MEGQKLERSFLKRLNPDQLKRIPEVSAHADAVQRLADAAAAKEYSSMDRIYLEFAQEALANTRRKIASRELLNAEQELQVAAGALHEIGAMSDPDYYVLYPEKKKS